jgi:hypothetical protein
MDRAPQEPSIVSRNLIVVAAVIEMFILSAVSQERRPEILTPSQPAFTAVRSKLPDDEPPHVAMVGASAENAHILADLVAARPVIPLRPRDLLRDYELEMASIAERLSADLVVISNAVRTEQIKREQGEYLSGERYQVAMMQFQLFSALHTIIEADIARTPAVAIEPPPSPAGEMVLVAMPFSSLQLNPSLVVYLGLNLTQVRFIQSLMDQERAKTEQLVLELRTVSAELGVAIRESQNTDDEGPAQSLAATQARLLKQLMRANSRLQRKIDAVLDPQQRKKLDTFKRLDKVTVGEGN